MLKREEGKGIEERLEEKDVERGEERKKEEWGGEERLGEGDRRREEKERLVRGEGRGEE